jgi:hypothetical protein
MTAGIAHAAGLLCRRKRSQAQAPTVGPKRASAIVRSVRTIAIQVG